MNKFGKLALAGLLLISSQAMAGQCGISKTVDGGAPISIGVPLDDPASTKAALCEALANKNFDIAMHTECKTLKLGSHSVGVTWSFRLDGNSISKSITIGPKTLICKKSIAK